MSEPNETAQHLADSAFETSVVINSILAGGEESGGAVLNAKETNDLLTLGKQLMNAVDRYKHDQNILSVEKLIRDLGLGSIIAETHIGHGEDNYVSLMFRSSDLSAMQKLHDLVEAAKDAEWEDAAP